MRSPWMVVGSLWLLIAVYSWSTMNDGAPKHETLTSEFALPDDSLIEKIIRQIDKNPIYLDDDEHPMTAFTDCEWNDVGRKCAVRQDRI